MVMRGYLREKMRLEDDVLYLGKVRVGLVELIFQNLDWSILIKVK